MKKKREVIFLSVASILLSAGVTFNLTPGATDFLMKPGSDVHHDPVTIDYLTIQTLVKAVSIEDIPVELYIDEIDSLNQTWNFSKVRNPFVKILQKKTKKSKRAGVSNKNNTKKGRPKIIVNGVVWDQQKPYAILNGEVYGVGDKLKGYTVQSITNSLVVLYNSKDLFSVKYEKE